MKEILKNFKSGITIGCGILFTLIIGGTIYASVNNIWTIPNNLEATTSGGLKSEDWNKILSNQNYLNGRVEGGTIVPTGAVMAFNLSTCPDGWSEANGTGNPLDLRGEFIRGLDNGRGVDSGRSLGSSQEDAFQGHWHDFYVGRTNYGFDHLNSMSQIALADNAGSRYLQSTLGGAQNQINAPKSDGLNGIPKISSETRPRNIALLYCVKD